MLCSWREQAHPSWKHDAVGINTHRLVTDACTQNVDEATASIDGVAETRMKLDFTLFKGASVRFENVETADIQASTLVENNKNIKNGTSDSLASLTRRTLSWKLLTLE